MASVPGKWNVPPYERFCCMPARFAPTLMPAMMPLASWPRGPSSAQPLDTNAGSRHAG